MKTLNCATIAMSFFAAAALFYGAATAQDIGAVDANIAIDTGDGDPGIFDTIALGETITLSGCFSTFVNAGASSGGSLCWPDPTDGFITSGADFDWTLVNDTTAASTTFNGLSVPLTTGGAGDFINAVGSYTLTLIVTARYGGEFITLSPVGHFGIQPGGVFGTETASFSFTSDGGPVSVPEPSAILLLLPALALIGRRQKLKLVAQAL